MDQSRPPPECIFIDPIHANYAQVAPFWRRRRSYLVDLLHEITSRYEWVLDDQDPETFRIATESNYTALATYLRRLANAVYNLLDDYRGYLDEHKCTVRRFLGQLSLRRSSDAMVINSTSRNFR